nr:hypothetical protein [uncultured Intestinibacter sp.]
MRFSFFGFSQRAAIDLGLDPADLLILRWFVDFRNSGKMISKEIDSKMFYLVSYSAVAEDLTILYMKKDSVYRRFKKMCDKNVLEKRVIKSKKTLVYFNTAENFPKLEDFSFIEKYIKNMKKENSYNYTPPQLNDAEDTCLDDKTICCDNNHNADICVDDNTICSDNNCDEVPCLDDKAISSDNICSDNNCSEDICVDNDAMSSYNNRNEYTEVSPKNTNPKTIKYAKAKSKKSKHSKSKSKSARQNVIKSEKIINKNISSSKITPANIKNYENKPEKVISQKTLKEVHYDDKSSSDKALNNSSNNPSNNFFNLRQHPIYLKQKLMLELLHILGLNPKPSIKNQTLLL